MAGRVAPKTQIRYGFAVMLSISLLNVAANALWPANALWALLPIGLFSFGWALMVPVITLLVLDLHPNRRGMASSMQAFVSALANGVVAGIVAPLVMGTTLGMALTSMALMGVGLIAWLFLHWRWPEIGRHAGA